MLMYPLTPVYGKNKTNGLTYGWKYYGDETHGSVPLISTYDALKIQEFPVTRNKPNKLMK